MPLRCQLVLPFSTCCSSCHLKAPFPSVVFFPDNRLPDSTAFAISIGRDRVENIRLYVAANGAIRSFPHTLTYSCGNSNNGVLGGTYLPSRAGETSSKGHTFLASQIAKCVRIVDSRLPPPYGVSKGFADQSESSIDLIQLVAAGSCHAMFFKFAYVTNGLSPYFKLATSPTV